MSREAINLLKLKADEAKAKLFLGVIDYEEAKKEAAPYIEAFNNKSKEIAKKYNQRPKMLNVAGFFR